MLNALIDTSVRLDIARRRDGSDGSVDTVVLAFHL
jgi:hypothetical protein